MGEIPLDEMLCRRYCGELDQVVGKGSLGGDERMSRSRFLAARSSRRKPEDNPG